jgi:hypothetical protein
MAADERVFTELSRTLGSLVVQAEQLSQQRCPYRNRLDECTAEFGCRNQRRPDEPGGRRRCSGDDLDYRKAWEV